MVTEEPSNETEMASVGSSCHPEPIQNLTRYEAAPVTSGQSSTTVPEPVACPVGVWGVSGATDGVREEGEMRSMSRSPSSQGWSVTDQERVPAVVSSVAEEAGSDRETEPSSSMKSSFWLERDAWGERDHDDGAVVPFEARDGSGTPAHGERNRFDDAVGRVSAYAGG